MQLNDSHHSEAYEWANHMDDLRVVVQRTSDADLEIIYYPIDWARSRFRNGAAGPRQHCLGLERARFVITRRISTMCGLTYS